MPGKSKLTADVVERAALRDLSKSEQRGAADRARALLLTLEGRRAGEITAAILNEDVRHDGGWTLPRLCAEIARRGGPAISARWLSHQLRQRGLTGGGRATPSKAARIQQWSK
jgi:transposase